MFDSHTYIGGEQIDTSVWTGTSGVNWLWKPENPLKTALFKT